MVQNPTSDTQEMFDDMSNDLASTEVSQVRRKTPSRPPKPSSIPKIILVIGILLVLILGAFFFRGSNSASKEDLNALKAKLDQMEKRLALLGMAENKITSLEDQFRGLQQSVSRFDAADKSLTEKVDKLTQQIEKPAPPPAHALSKSSVKPSSKKAEASPSKAAVAYHKVSPGETLYRIANRYNMTVDELRRLNNLKPNQAIMPGQKLAIAPSHP
jgi:LysM repeat protein